MKTKFYHILTALLLVGIFATNCKKDENNDLIEDNGLSRDINDFISEDIFDILDSLGMPINTGGNPTNIEGSYFVSPSVLTSSNRNNDIIGKKYNDVTLKFSNQNNSELTLITSYVQGQQESEGYGSFIVGDGNAFTVFAKIKTINQVRNDSALSTQIYSGKLTAEGIVDLYTALVLLNDYGDPNDEYIEIGDSRVFYDEDGLSEKVENEKSIRINVQDEPIIAEGALMEMLNYEKE